MQEMQEMQPGRASPHALPVTAHECHEPYTAAPQRLKWQHTDSCATNVQGSPKGVGKAAGGAVIAK